MGAGGYVVDGDADGAELHGEIAHEHAHAALGRAVAGEIREDHVLVDGRNVDDAARLFGVYELLTKALGEEEAGFEVGVEDEIVVGLGGLKEGRVALDAGVVDEDVAAAELSVGLFDEVLDVGGLGDVGLEDDAFAACGFDFGADSLGSVGVAEEVDDDGAAF